MAGLWESFYEAHRALNRDQTERMKLIEAYEEIHCGDTEGLPEYVRPQFDELIRGMMRVQISGKQGRWQASVDMMSDQEVKRMIECILDIWAVVSQNDELSRS